MADQPLPSKAMPAAVKPKAKPPPAALQRQMLNASARWDDNSSVSSWVRLEEETSAAALSQTLDGVSEEADRPTDQEAHQPKGPVVNIPPPPPVPQSSAVPQPPQPAAPAVQAAQSIVDHAHEFPASRRLRRQQEAAARRGRRAFRRGQMTPADLARNPLNSQLPGHLSQIGSNEGERSILILDNRDNRVQSPFQGWLIDEVLTNALSYVNVKSDRSSVRTPSTGYHFNIFMVRTLDGVKVTLCGSATCYSSVPCARWDALTGDVLSHAAFQPFRWPPMTESSPTWVDVKIKLEGHLLVHLELRGYRSDHDMAIQLWHVADAIHTILSETVFIPSVVVTVFQGWRVIACSFEVGGRLYACSEGGVVVALDFPLCHFECRFVATSSPDSFGADADRLEMRFLSASDRIDVAVSSAAIPPSWLAFSRVSGPTLIRSASWGREHGARVECPDQALQFAQLAAVHAHWTAKTEATTAEETGPRISAIAVESNAMNAHLVSESPFFKKERVIVKAEALALQSHDPLDEVLATVMPPLVDGPAVRSAEVAPKLAPALLGPSTTAGAASVPNPVSSAVPSVTAPGQAPAAGSWMGGTLAPSRRSLEQRRADALDHSAMTPQAFVESARAVNRPRPFRSHQTSQVRIDEIPDESVDRPGEPKSFKPAQPENFTDV